MKSSTSIAAALLFSLMVMAARADAPIPVHAGKNFTAAHGMEMVWVAPLKCWVEKYPVTQDEYDKVAGETPCKFSGGRNPVENVSWNEANDFCIKLTQKESASGALPEGYRYSLPTNDQYALLMEQVSLNDAVTSMGVPRTTTEPVGSKGANQYGLYDIVGNVREWCEDWYTVEINLKNTFRYDHDVGETHKVFCGASWHDTKFSPGYTGFLPPDRHSNDTGFRCVLALNNFPDSASALKPVGSQTSPAPSTPAAMSFSGTTWSASGDGTSIVQFESNGRWTEDWKQVHLEGRWRANDDNTGVDVVRDDNFRFHYTLNTDKTLVRDRDHNVYHLASSSVSLGALNPVGSSGSPTPSAPSGDPGLKITYIAEGSARLEPKGFKEQNFSALDTDDPNDIAIGKPLYFDLHTGKEVHYQVESAQPLTKLIYTGVAFRKFQIEIRDLAGNVLAVSGIFDYGNHQQTVEMSLPGITRFKVVIHNNDRDWLLVNSLVFESNGIAQGLVRNQVGSSAPPTPNSAPGPNTSAMKMTEDQARAVVLITGDNAVGTGFMIKTADGPFVVTNLHVIGNNPNFKITTNSGAIVPVLSAKAASDRDLVLLAIKDDGYNYLEASNDVSRTVQPGDEVITPGNSEGGGVMLNTDGKVLGIGPVRIEFDNPVYHGNSGGPVFQPKSGKVLGVVTEAMKVDISDELDKASFANRNSAIGSSMRYFGLRLDTVSAWVPLDWKRFKTETDFLDQFDKRSHALDCYLNAPDDNKPEDTLWQKDEKIMKASLSYFDEASGADGSQKMNATRTLYSGLGDIANLDMAAIQNPNNFYGFDQQRAKDELAYRKALKTELEAIGNNVSRMGSLPRSNK